MARHILLASTECFPGREQEFNDWYDTVHVPDVLAVPGYVRGQRFDAIPDMSGRLPANRFLAIYEFETDDPAAALAALGAAMGSMQIDPSFDRSRTRVECYTEHGAAQVAQ